MKMSPPTPDLPSGAVNSGNGSRGRTANFKRSQDSHVAAAAAIDELLASEARASLQRARASHREEPLKAKIRVNVPPARIVARPLQSPAWQTPFFSLAMVVGVSTLLSAGAISYLLMRPANTSGVSEADLRSIRESVIHLRRQVAEITNVVATNRSAIDAMRAQPADFAARAHNPAEREQAAQVARSVRQVDERIAAAAAAVALPPEITGSVSPAQPPRATSAPREIIAGWQVRRVYDGVAILEGKSGVIEVMPGQDVPALGRIQEIRNENNRWQVLTSKGVVLSGR